MVKNGIAIIENAAIPIIVGKTYSVVFAIVDGAGEAIDLTAAEYTAARIQFRTDYADADPVLEGDTTDLITLGDGTLEFKIEASESAALSADLGSGVFGIELTYDDGVAAPILTDIVTGTFSIKPSAVHA